MTEDRTNPAQAENLPTFEKMLNEFADSVYHAGTQERVLPPYAVQEHQALIDYVKRLEARQITPEMERAYEIWRDSRKMPRLDPSTEEANAYSIITALGWLIDPDGTYEMLNGEKRDKTGEG